MVAGYPMKRRIFLRGLGGACVAAPFLGSLSGRGLKAQSTEPPRRLIAMYTHAGCITNRFFPTKSHGALSAADLEATTLRHLAPFVDKLLLPRGIRAMNEWTTDMSRGQGNDNHLQAVASYFTCQPVTPNSNDPFSFDNATKFQAKPVGPSLDHVMAKQLSSGGIPLYMRVSGTNDSPQTCASYSAPETAFPGFGSAAQVFAELTGLFQGDELSPDSYQVARGKSIIDAVRDDLDTLERFDMSQADHNKLEAWKALLDDTGGVVVPALCNQDLAATLGATQDNVDLASTSTNGQDRLTTMLSDSLDVADLHSNLAVLAAVCNYNPVTFLKYPFAYVFSGLGLTSESEGLAHRIGNASMLGTCLTGVVEKLLTIDDYYTRKFAHLVDVLNRIDEGDGKLLDYTAAVWFQGMSDGCAHNLNNIPIVHAGSAGGYFKTGWAINVEDGRDDLSNGNSEYYCGEDGRNNVESFTMTGTDPSLANAPINKYFCNLMNALGVRAGADGFPAVGGTEEVTHFGMYDKTEDFVGGGTNPPMIRSPGGFDELKALT